MSLEERKRAICFALQRSGAPYTWGAKGRFLWTPAGLRVHAWEECYDCSGLVATAFLFGSGIDLREHYSAQTIYDECEPTPVPRTATVACYGAGDRCAHVMLHVADGIVVGASGGGPDIKSPADAKHRQRESGLPCSVHVYCDRTYRKDFLGWRELPFREAPP